MAQQDKELLLRDLSARQPYGVILQVSIFDNGDIKYHNEKLNYRLLSLIELDGGYYFRGLLCKYPKFTAKPYLRPMSSMTENECYELHYIRSNFTDNWKYIKTPIPLSIANYNQVDWLNAHHFDYRGLIEKGLAIEVTPENNPYK